VDKDLFSKFSIYDHLGYLFVGALGLLVAAADLLLLDRLSNIPDLTAASFVPYLVVAYFCGHVIHALANVVIKEKKSNFTEGEKEILEEARRHFKLEKQSWSDIYLLCYMLSSAKDVTGQVQSFNAYYSLYRGWFVIFLLQSLFLLLQNILNWPNIRYVSLLFFSMVLAMLLFARMKRFYRYSRSKTLQTFILLREASV